VDPAGLVSRAAQCFEEGAHASFYACFRDDVKVYPEPALASGKPLVSSCDELVGWLERALASHPELDVKVADIEAHGPGVICDAMVVGATGPAEVWRIALAVLCEDSLIREVRAFWGREAAGRWLVKFG
jgi:hypothetical protein